MCYQPTCEIPTNPLPNHILIRILMFLMVGFIFSFQAVGQESENKKILEISFVKTDSEQSSDSLYFNVLRIHNLTTERLELVLDVRFPEVLQCMTAIPTHITLQPNGKNNLAFRVSVTKNAVASKNYQLVATLKNKAGNQLAQAEAQVKVKPKRSWELLSPVTEINVISTTESTTAFSVTLRNNGNMQEKIDLLFTPPEGYQIKNSKRSVDQVSVDLPAARDTVLTFNLYRKGKEKLTRTEDRLEILARNSLCEFRKSIRVNTYSSHFEYVREKINLDNFFEISHQVNLPNAQNREAFQAQGKIPLTKEGREIQYSFMNYDLTNRQSFWERSYYNLNYSGKMAKYGIGQSYSGLGVDLYNMQGVFGNLKVDLNKTNQLEFYSSVGLNGDINCGAAGYQFKKGDFSLQTSSGYSTNNYYKQNIGSVSFLSQIPLGKAQTLGLNMRAVTRENLGDSVYYTSGLQGNFSYRLKLGSRFNFQVRNLFNTPSFNRTNQSQFDLDLTSCYTMKNNKGEWCFSFNENQRVYNAGQKLKQMGAESSVDDNNVVLYLKKKLFPKMSIKIGPLYKRLSFDEKLQTSVTNSYNLYLEAKKEGPLNYTASLITGIRLKTKTFPFGDGTASMNKKLGNVHFTGALNGSFWGLNVQYDYGPPQMLSNMRDMDYWLLRISPQLRGDFFHEKLLCQVNLDYTSDWGRKYKYINFRTTMETILKNNWRISLDSYISTFGKLCFNTLGQDLRLDFRLSLRKDFNWGKKKEKIKYNNLSTYFFQDNNKNGVFDPGEQGIANGFLKMSQEKSSAEQKYIYLSSVISDKTGKVSYANIPQGEYQMDISRMQNEDGYFNFNNSKQVIKLQKDTICYIPFVKAYLISGILKVTLANITSGKINSIKNIRITATDSKGQQYNALTNDAGRYILPVAGKEIYTVSINNPYTGNVEVKNNNTKIEFTDKDEAIVDFEFIERARKVKMKSASGATNFKENEKVREVIPSTVDQSLPDKKINPGSNQSDHPIPSESKPTKKDDFDLIPDAKDTGTLDSLSLNKEKNMNERYWIYTQISPDGNSQTCYWVVGAFRNMESTNLHLQYLRQKNIFAKWLYYEAYGLYYVYVKKTTNMVSKP